MSSRNAPPHKGAHDDTKNGCVADYSVVLFICRVGGGGVHDQYLGIDEPLTGLEINAPLANVWELESSMSPKQREIIC